LRAVLGAVAVLTAAGAGAWWIAAHRTAPASATRPRNVLLITVDTLRADALGAYGNSSAATPWLDRLSAAGIRFDNARAHNVVTLPSHANILTGRLPVDHGVHDNGGFRLPAKEETLAVRLHAAGFRTGAFISAFPLDSRFGLARGFDVYDDAFVDAAPRPAMLEQERAGADTVAAAAKWVSANGAAPWFCWVHVYEPHFPYRPPEPYASRFASNAYAGEVAATDAALGPLLQPILDSPPGDTIVVVTSDHGESLGEHGEETHGIFAYDATLKVPLIVYAPSLLQASVKRDPAGHVDIAPTILDALGLPPLANARGHSLIGATHGPAAGAAYFEALSGTLNRGWAPLRGVVRAGLKYIELPVPELYDLAADPAERRNLAAARPKDVEELGRLTRTFDDGEPRRSAETAEVTERLRSLGYVSSSARKPSRVYTDSDDPKRQIQVEGALQEVVRLFLSGDLTQALEKAKSLTLAHPEMRVALLQLAHLERESGDLPAAIAALRRALSLNPADQETASLLGAYLTSAHRAAEAVALLQPYAASDADVQTLVALALAQARQAQFDDARKTLDRARAQDPSNAMLLVQAGTVEVMAGRRAEAREAFEGALRLNPGVARAHSSLAALAAEDGRADVALSHWRAAGERDPGEYRTVLAIAMTLARAGRNAEARRYVEFFVDIAPPALYASDIDHARSWLGGNRAR